MSTETRNLSNIDGAAVGIPDENMFTANGIPAYANDAAYAADFTPAAGSIYFNTTDKALREYNGTSWQYDKLIFSTQTDAATTGADQDIVPSLTETIIRYTSGTLASIRGIASANQKVLIIVNDQATQVITLKNQDLTAAAATRIITGNNQNLEIYPGDTVSLFYDEDTTRWHVLAAYAPSRKLEAFASDAAYASAHPGALPTGAIYWNTTDMLVRQYNGTDWQNDKTSFTTQTDSTTTGSAQDITPNSFNQIISFTQGSLASIRSVVPTIQKLMHIVNGQASQVITIKNEDLTATAANRIVTGTGADFSLSPGQICTLIYETQGTRWRLAGGAASSGTGGRINLISHPNDATGWTETGTVFDGGVTTTTTSADLPLEGVIPTAIKITAGTGANPDSGTEATDYVSFPVTTSAVMNGRLQIDLYMRPGSGFLASEWTVSVYQGSTRVSLEQDVSSVSYLPNGAVRYVSSCDVLASTAYTVRFARISGTGVAVLNIVNVFFGWPDVSKISGPSLYETVSTYTFGAISTPPTPGTGATFFRETVNNGDGTATIRYEFRQSVAGTAGSGDYLLPLPTGLTINYARTGVLSTSSTNGDVGKGTIFAGSSTYDATACVSSSASYANKIHAFISNDVTASVSWSGVSATLANASVQMSITVRVAINEWAGAGLQTGPGSEPEFVSHNGTSQSSDWALVPNIAGATSSTTYTITPQYPCQSGDLLEVEFRTDAGVIIAGGPYPYTEGTSSFVFGLQLRKTTTGTIQAIFGNGGIPAGGGLGAAGTTWATLRATGTGWYWRIRKYRNGQLPFAKATATNSGLYPSFNSLTKIRLNTGNGYGSTNTKIRRFTNTVVNTGSGITYADSATLGATFTVTEAGLYCFSYSECLSGGSNVGLSLNSTQLTTNIESITTADRLCLSVATGPTLANTQSITLALAVGDVVRPHTDGVTESVAPSRVHFTVQRIA